MDKNNDGIINELDLYYLGNTNPDLMGGIGPRIQYKGLTINAFFHFKLGQEIINGTRIDTEKMYNHDNQSTATNWRWRGPGDAEKTDIPRALYNKGFNWLGSTRFVEDGSFVRFKTASIKYDFPEKLCNYLNIKKMDVYATMYNLFTWTNYSGQDPEVAPPNKPDKLPIDYSRTPPGRKILLGLNITF